MRKWILLVALITLGSSAQAQVSGTAYIDMRGVTVFVFPDTVIGQDSIPRFSFYCNTFGVNSVGDTVCVDAPYVPMCLFYRDDRGPRKHELCAPLPVCDSLYAQTFLPDSSLHYFVKPLRGAPRQ